MVGGTASAQYIGGNLSNWNNPISATANSILMAQMHGKLQENQQRRAAAAGSRTGGTPMTASALDATRFVPSSARHTPTSMAQSLPAHERRQALAVYEALLDGYRRFIVDSGEHARLHDNVAGALTFMLLGARFVLTEGEELGDVESAALLADLHAALVDMPAFAAMPDPERQHLHDVFAITGSLVVSLYQSGIAEGDATQVAEARALAGEVFAQVLDRGPVDVRFTAAGLDLR